MRLLSSRLALVSLALWALALPACFAEADSPGSASSDSPLAALATVTEGFEAGSKTSYAVADVTLGTGTWTLDEALIGTSSSDYKVGAKSARVRNAGRLTMKFDRSAGASTVTVRHAAYGTDSNGSWGLYYSSNQGSTWTQAGSSVTTSGHTLATASFTINVSGAIRLQLRKLDGGSNRINFDDIVINDYSGGGGGGGGGGGAGVSRHTALGLPTPASTADFDDYLSVKTGYVISYNSGLKVPNWVSWELNTSYLGSTARQDDFRPDSTLPGAMAQASLADYSGSGYDRGHMAPSADRTLTVAANSETFYLSNMVPQAANNNQGPWAVLENYARSLATGGKELFIVSGGTFSASSNWVGSGVMVPDQTFKVIVVLDGTTQGAADVTSSTRVIGVLMPNDDSQISRSADWRSFRVSVDQIEALTGQDLLSDVAPAVQSVIEARVDNL